MPAHLKSLVLAYAVHASYIVCIRRIMEAKNMCRKQTIWLISISVLTCHFDLIPSLSITEEVRAKALLLGVLCVLF